MMATCLCGCNEIIDGSKSRGEERLYYNDACRQRAKRKRDKSVTEDVSESFVRSIRPILKWPGAKWRMASWIISHFPEHRYYVEPFCGSAACFFTKDPSQHEVINDLDSSLVNLFRIIRERGPELALLIEMTPWAREEYESVERDYAGSGDDLEDARRFLIRCWQAHGTRLSSTSGWRHKGVHGGSGDTSELWNKLPERLLATIKRLKHAEIEHRPALDIIARYNAPDVLLYVDPPYMLSTRNGKFYSHEMKDTDHLALLEALQMHRGSVVLSGYTHPLYEEKLALWQHVTLPSQAEHGQLRTEVLWLNARAQRRQLSLFEEVD